MNIRRESFVDAASGSECVLVVPAGGRCFPTAGEAKIGVVHPGCGTVADLTVELDCFYCAECGWNGRVSGAWAANVIAREAER